MSGYGPKIDQLLADFAVVEDWEERYRYVIDLGRDLAPLSDVERNETNKVRGCASQVWLVPAREGERYVFRGDSDAPLVKGLVAVLLMLYSDATADQIRARDARALFAELGLSGHLSPQRSNGFFAMVERIRAFAAE